MSSPNEKFKIRTRTQILFGLMFALLMGAVLVRFNFENEQVRLWVQVSLIVLMMVLGLLEIHRINRGLQRLAKVSELIGQGDFNARAASGTQDALGLLGKAINTMAGQIESSIQERERSQAELVKSKEALDRQNEQLSASFTRQTRFGEFLADLASIDINTLANKSLSHLMAAGQAQLGAFYLFDETTRRLVCLNSQGLDRSAMKHIAQENNLDGLPGEVFLQQKWLFVEGSGSQPLPTLDFGVARAQLRCIYGIPLLFRNKALGVVVLAGLTKPDQPQVEFLRNHVDALAHGLNNALSYKAINHQSVLLEKANEELRKSDQLRSEFVANMSHELRTPLNSIIGFSGILLKNKTDTLDEADLKRAEKIHRNGKHLLHLINDILDLSKIEAGRMEVTFGPTRLASLFHEVADLLQPQADAKGIELKLELAAAEQVLETDDQKLRQVLINLAGNAIKFTRQGSVTLRLLPAEKGEGALVRVEDTGVGIPQDKLDTIFEAFRQADSSTTREFGGTGLGLTISRSLVKLIGGTLTVTSEEGKGSIFSINLPARSSESSPPPISLSPRNGIPAPEPLPSPVVSSHRTYQSLTAFIRKETAPKKRGVSTSLIEEYREVFTRSLPIKPGQRVLVVDDDADARELISQFIEDLGAKAIPCACPLSVLRIATEEKPDLITLDLMMPERSGWEVLSALKAEPSLSNIPVIIISIVADRRKAISLGAVDALTKPILRTEFNASVERNLRTGVQQLGKVLIVEDDPDARNLMSAWLESEVSELKTATNGQEALTVLEGFRPDVIFLDLQMPVMDGPTFLQHLRADERFTDLPVIVITAKALEVVERKRLEPQVSKILSKGEVFAQ